MCFVDKSFFGFLCLDCSSRWTVLATDILLANSVTQHSKNLCVKVHSELRDVHLVKLEHLGTDQLSTRRSPICEMYRNIVTKAGHRRSGTLTRNMMFEPYDPCGKTWNSPFLIRICGCVPGPN